MPQVKFKFTVDDLDVAAFGSSKWVTDDQIAMSPNGTRLLISSAPPLRTSEVLQIALDRLRDDGWVQGNFEVYGEGAFGNMTHNIVGRCAIGALEPSQNYWEATQLLAEVIREQYPEFNPVQEIVEAGCGCDMCKALNATAILPSRDFVISWNDTKGRTWEEVERVFEKAYLRALDLEAIA